MYMYRVGQKVTPPFYLSFYLLLDAIYAVSQKNCASVIF